MKKIQIYAEDTHCEAFAVLAERAIQQAPNGISSAPVVRASRRIPRDWQEMLTLVRNAHKDGYHYVVFIVDREGEWSKERPALIAGICQAFARLCRELPSCTDLADVRVALVIANRCLESWLLADVDGLIDYARGPRGLHRFTGNSFRSSCTEDVDRPDRRINALFKQVANARGGKPKRCEKSNLKAIARFVEPKRARNNNSSLAYFFEMVTTLGDGCSHPYQRKQCP